PKPAVTVAGNETVKWLTDQSRNYQQAGKQLPASFQPSGYAQRRIRTGIIFTLFQQYYGIRHIAFLPGNSSPCPLPNCALQGSKMKISPGIVPDYKLHRAFAKVANPIKEHDGTVIGRQFRHIYSAFS